MLRRFLKTLAVVATLAVVGVGGPIVRDALSQAGFTLLNPVIVGHYTAAGSPPTLTGCTIVAGSTDTDGQCATTATSGTITFVATYVTAPSCIVADASATSTVSMPVYTVSTTAITLSTIISGHTLYWHCAGKVGG